MSGGSTRFSRVCARAFALFAHGLRGGRSGSVRPGHRVFPIIGDVLGVLALLVIVFGVASFGG